MKQRLNFLKDKPLVIILGIALLLLFILGLTSGCTKKNTSSLDNKDEKFGKMGGERPNRSDLPPNFSRTEDERPKLSNMTIEEMEEFRKNGMDQET